MEDFKEGVTKLFKKEDIKKEEINDYIISFTKNDKKNQKELVELLPFMIQNSNEYNLYWMHYIHNYSNIENFLDIFIDNIFSFNFRRYNFLFMKILK